MTAVGTHPVQLSLPGQSHVAEGPHDQAGMYVMHHAFRRDLARFEQAVRTTPVHETGTWAALRRRWQRFGEVLHHHHEVEDTAMWPLLRERAVAAGEPDAVALLAAMEAEHGGIDPALEACADGFRSMVGHPCDDHRNALDVCVTSARAALLAHLAHEEREALPLLQRVFSVEDFAATEKAAGAGYPVRLVPFLLAWVADGLPADAMARILADAPPGYGLLLRLSRVRYERVERTTFRHG